MEVSITIMTHHTRLELVKRILFNLPDNADVRIALDDGSNEWETGKCALLSYGKNAMWHIILQDDALIGYNFLNNAIAAIRKAPFYAPISFYTGTVRPFKERVEYAVQRSTLDGTSFIQHNRLMWGVGFAIPVFHIEPMLEYVKDMHDLPFDQRISAYYDRPKESFPVLYTNPSIVDHDYTIPSIANSDYEGEPRRSHRYDPNLIDWNSKVTEMW